MTPEERQLLYEMRDALYRLEKSDRYTLEKTIQMLDGRDIQVGKSNGTLFGTEVTQKLGFFGARSGVAVIQPVADTIGTTANTYSTAFFADATWGNNELNMVNAMYQAMIGLGLIREV